jgi:hypothetical protein
LGYPHGIDETVNLIKLRLSGSKSVQFRGMFWYAILFFINYWYAGTAADTLYADSDSEDGLGTVLPDVEGYYRSKKCKSFVLPLSCAKRAKE